MFYIHHIGMTVAMLRTALISATCVLAVISLFTFIAGIVCGHYLSQSWRSSADRSKQPESHQINPENIVSDLELKENVAYITLRPTT